MCSLICCLQKNGHLDHIIILYPGDGDGVNVNIATTVTAPADQLCEFMEVVMLVCIHASLARIHCDENTCVEENKFMRFCEFEQSLHYP